MTISFTRVMGNYVLPNGIYIFKNAVNPLFDVNSFSSRLFTLLNGTSYFDFQNAVTLTGEKYIRFKLKTESTISDFIRCYGPSGATSTSRMLILGSGEVRWYPDDSTSSAISVSGLTIQTDSTYDFEIYSGVNGRYISVNGVMYEETVTDFSSRTITIDYIGNNYETASTPCTIYDFELVGDAQTHHWSLGEDGSQTSWIYSDSIGGNDATLINGTADDIYR